MIKAGLAVFGMACAALAQAANPVTNTFFTADPAALVDKARPGRGRCAA